MKRKVMMIMGLTMVIGFPHGVCFGFGGNGKGSAHSYSSWNASYTPHYGAEGAAKPLMDHVSVSSIPLGQNTRNTWRMDFTPPLAVSHADDPLSANDKRVGLSLKLGF